MPMLGYHPMRRKAVAINAMSRPERRIQPQVWLNSSGDDPDVIHALSQDHDIPDEAESELRAVVQAQIIECLNRFYAMETGMWGGPVSALIIRTVIKGQFEGNLYDLSALGAVLDLPVASVHRKVRQLVEEGYLQRLPRGKSVYLTPTEKTCVTLDKSFDDMISTLQRLYRGGVAKGS